MYGISAHLEPAITPLQRGGFPQQKCILKDIYTEIIFMKYKEEIQVITTVKEFLRFHTNPSNRHYANCLRWLDFNERWKLVWHSLFFPDSFG